MLGLHGDPVSNRRINFTLGRVRMVEPEQVFLAVRFNMK
jgi:hypothetical protein